ncbi:MULTISPECIES: hypothetical protein [Spirulina sp. CCY15215]|nr:hypothetical protein [Spirulina major]
MENTEIMRSPERLKAIEIARSPHKKIPRHLAMSGEKRVRGSQT